jgi:hypothetical protein
MQGVYKPTATVGKTVAVIYFVFFMSPALLLVMLSPFLFFSKFSEIVLTGYFVPDAVSISFGIMVIVCGVTSLSVFPPLRYMYVKLPWLLPFLKIAIVHLVFVSIVFLSMRIIYYTSSLPQLPKRFWIAIAICLVCRLTIGRMCVNNEPKPFLDRDSHE